MDFDLTEEQSILKDSLDRLLAADDDPDLDEDGEEEARDRPRDD